MTAALDSTIRERIVELLDAGLQGKDIAMVVGCSPSQVSRVRHARIIDGEDYDDLARRLMNDQVIGYLRNTFPRRWMAVVKSMKGDDRIEWLNGIADATLAFAEHLFTGKYADDLNEACDE